MNKMLIPLLLLFNLPLQSALQREECFFGFEEETKENIMIEKLSLEVYERSEYPYAREIIFKRNDNEMDDTYIFINDKIEEKICIDQYNCELSFGNILKIIAKYAPDEELPFRHISIDKNKKALSRYNQTIRDEIFFYEIKFQLLDNNKILRLFRSDTTRLTSFVKDFSFVELYLPEVLSSLLNVEKNISLVMIAEEVYSLLKSESLSDMVMDEVKAFDQSLKEKFRDAGYLFYPKG